MISPAAVAILLRRIYARFFFQMANWATIPYELLTLIVNILDRKSTTQFRLVCKHWNKPATYINFEAVNISNLRRFSSFVRLILSNQALGAALLYIYFDVKGHEERIADEVPSEELGDDLLRDAINDYEKGRDEAYRNLFSIVLRFIPNIRRIHFSARDNYQWYEVLEDYADHLKHLNVITPPATMRDFYAYCPVAWKLRESLEKMTFVNQQLDADLSHSSGRSLLDELFLTNKASEFTNLTEIRIELIIHRGYDIPLLERVIDNVPTSVDFIALSSTILYAGRVTVKLVFPAVDLSATKPLPHIRKLRTLHNYFCDDNAIKYITHKFPNVQELEYRCGEQPWKYVFPETPNQLSPGIQTMYFEYFMKMAIINVFGVYRIEDFRSVMSRWMAVANAIKDKHVTLTLTEDGSVDDNCLYVFWKKDFPDVVYDISVHYNYESAWSYDMSIPVIGSCLSMITLENVDLTSQRLTAIYQGCPSLVQLVFRDVIILGEMDTGEVTSNVTHLSFEDMEDNSAKWISSITKNLASLYLLQIHDTDMTVPTTTSQDETITHHKDLAFDISATHAYGIRYTPTYEMLRTHEFVPPWCVIFNDTDLYLNPNAFEEGPYKQIAFTQQVPLEEFENYKKQIVSSKRDHSYCLRLQCQSIHCFQLTKHSEEVPDATRDDRDKPAEDSLCLVIN